MARVADVAAAWGALAGEVLKGAATRIAWRAPLAATLFLVGALALHRAWFGTTGWSALLPALTGGLLFLVFGLVGAATGAGLALTSTARALRPRLEAEVDRLLGPLVARVVQHALGGEQAVSIERFLRALGERLVPWDTGADAARPSRATRVLMAGATWLVRRVLAREFRGQDLVLADAVGRFARERLLGLVLDRLRMQLHAEHLALLGLAAVAVLGPLIYLVAGG